MFRWTTLAALAALTLPAAAIALPSANAPASDPTDLVAVAAPSAFSYPLVVPAQGARVLMSGDGTAEVISSVLGTRLESIGYRPRRYGRPSYVPPFVTQVHAGFYDPKGDPSSGFLFGLRAGPLVDPHVLLGVQVDWSHKEDRTSDAIGGGFIPGVGDVTLIDDRLRTRTDFVPILAIVQVSADERLPIIPYAGIGGGYEVLGVTADLPNGERFDATYGGWGWQLWGGAAFPLSGQARLSGEVYMNQSTLGRDVEDALGHRLREEVDFDGVGARFGVSWGF